MIDSLEQRQLLSVSAGSTLQLATGTQAGTVNAQSVATDDNGDTAVVWTAENTTYDESLGTYVTDTNVYAEYLTYNTQEIHLAKGTESFYLIYGGDTITQRLSFSTATPVGSTSATNIAGTVKFKFGDDDTNAITVDYYESATFGALVNTISAESTSVQLLVEDGVTIADNTTILVGNEYITINHAELFGKTTAGDVYTCSITRGANDSVAVKHNSGSSAARNYTTFVQDLQSRMQALGGQFADATVTAVNATTFDITYDVAVSSTGERFIYETASDGSSVPVLVAQKYWAIDQESTAYTSGYLPAAQMAVKSEPILIGKITVNQSNAAKTVSSLTSYLEGKTADSDIAAPVIANMPQYDVDLVATGLDVTVTSVTSTDDPNGLYHFYVTFKGTSGYDVLDKLIIVDAKKADKTDVTSSNETWVKIVKESSGVFRVNPTEIDDVATYGLDLTDQYSASVAMDGDGDFIITWISEEADGSTNIYARRFSSKTYDATPDESNCWTYTAMNGGGTLETYTVQCVAAVSADENLVLVADNPNVDDSTYTTFQVNTIETVSMGSSSVGDDDESVTFGYGQSDRCSTSVAMDDAGNFVISWSSQGQDYSYFNEVFVRQFTADGKPVDIEYVVSPADANAHGDSYVAMSNTGLVAVSWVSYDPLRVDVNILRTSVSWALYNLDGTRVSSGNVGGAATNPSICFDSQGYYLLTWEQPNDNDVQNTPRGGWDSRGVYASLFSPTGGTVLSTFRANTASTGTSATTQWPGYQGGAQAAIDADGDITIVFEGYGADVSDFTYTGATNIAAYLDEQLALPENADLLEYIDTSSMYSLIYSSGDPDSIINSILAAAKAKMTAGTEIGTLVGTAAGTGDNTTINPDVLATDTDLVIVTDENYTLNFFTSGNITYITIDGEMIAIDASQVSDITQIAEHQWGYVTDGNRYFRFQNVKRGENGTDAASHSQNDNVSSLDVALTTDQIENKLGRISAIHDSVLTLLRGDAYGVIFSQYDANPTAGSTAVTVADATANAQRDGSNETFNLIIDNEVSSGSLTIRIWNPNGLADEHVDVTVTPVFDDNKILKVEDTRKAIEAALQSATAALGDAWQTNIEGFSWKSEQTIVVRTLSSYEIDGRMGTDWEVVDGGGTAVESDEVYVFEITFVGSVHDMDMDYSIEKNDLKASASEIQTVVFSTPGAYTATIHAVDDVEKTVSFWFDSSKPESTAWSLAGAISALAESDDDRSGGLNVEVSSLDGLTYTVTYSGAYAGINQALVAGSLTTTTTSPTGVVSTQTVGNVYSYATKEGGDVTAFASIATVVEGDQGTAQHDVSIGMQSNGTFVISYTQSDEYTNGSTSGQSIQVQVVDESTDTAGPSVTALETADGMQILADATTNVTTGLKQIVIDFSEAMYCVADVETQLNALGVTQVTSKVGTKVNGVTLKKASNSQIKECEIKWSKSVLNADNYALELNGEELSSSIVDVYYGLNEAYVLGLSSSGTNKYQVVLYVDSDSSTVDNQALAGGTYTVRVRHYVPTSLTEVGQSGLCDANGNSLGLTGYTTSTNGADAELTFTLVVSGDGTSTGADDPTTPGSNQTDTPTNTTTAGDQVSPVVGTAADGSYVIVWTSCGQGEDDAAEGNIVAQRYTPTGTKLGNEFTINTYTTGNQATPAIAMNDAGDFVVTWYGEGADGVMGVYARCYNAKGQATSKQFQVSTTSTNTVKAPSVAIANDGTFVVAWTVYDTGNLQSHVFARCYTSTASPASGAFQIDTAKNLSNQAVDVAVDTKGDIVVVWQSFSQTGQDWDIHGRVFHTATNTASDEFVINTFSTGLQIDPAVAMADDGSFIVSWSSYGQDAEGTYGVYARMYNVDGSAKAAPFLVNKTVLSNQYQSDVSCDASGNFSIVWSSYGEDSILTNDYGIYARMFKADGTDYQEGGKDVGVFRVNATVRGNQVTPALSRNISNGDYVVVWAGPDNDGTGIFFRRLDPEVGGTGGSETLPTLAINDVSGSEGSGTLTFTINLSAPSTSDVVVYYCTADTTATADLDYEKIAGGHVTIAAGSTSATVTVNLINDHKVESNESFLVTLYNATGATIADANGKGTILNDDTVPTVSIGNASCNESDGTMTFTLTLSSPSDVPVFVNYYADGITAASGSDYVSPTGTAMFAANTTSVTITVPIVNDSVVEGNETFKVTLSEPSGATLGSAVGTGTIINDDSNLPSLSIGNATASEAAGTMTFTVTLSAVSATDVTVKYTTAAGSAAAGTDFTATTGTLVIAAGSTTGTIVVPLANDATYEGNETFTVALSEASGATIASSTGTGTITNDDVLPTLSIGNASAKENAGNMIFTVTLSAAATTDVTVKYSLASGTAIAGSDFGASGGTLTIAAGSTTGTISVPMTVDSEVESNETFTVKLTEASGATIVGDTGTATIIDSSVVATLPTISIGNATVSEDGGSAVFTVTLSAASASDVTVDYAAVTGTAALGTDFTATNGKLTIAAGSTTGQIVVPIVNDAAYEGNEIFTVALSNASGATIAGATGTGIITNDDALPTLSIGNASAKENAGSMTFTVTLSAASAVDVTVDYATASGAATAGSDFTSTSGKLTIAAGSTTGQIVVPLTNDAANEGDEAFTVVLTNASGATIASATGTGTITNDDGVLPTLSIGNASAKENAGKVTFTVTLSSPSTSDVSVKYSTVAGTAVAGSDFTAKTGTLVIAAGSTTGTITIDLIGDAKVESDETFTVSLADASGATIVGASGTGSVLNDDKATSTTVALYDGKTSTWYLKDTNTQGDADTAFCYGPAGAGWIALTGDWDGDGEVTVGLYNPKTSTFYLKNTNTQGNADLAFNYGAAGAGWTPIIGDWDGDGKDTVGMYNGATSTFYLTNTNAQGVADLAFNYGAAGAGWKPVVGDWNADGKDTVGMYNGATGTFYLTNTNAQGNADLAFNYGAPGAGWTPVIGDWNSDGQDTVGVYDSKNAVYYLTNANVQGNADIAFSYGPAGKGWTPVVGDWDGLTVSAMQAESEVVAISTTVSTLSQTQLSSIASEAISRWAAAGLSDELVAKLQSVKFDVKDLAGNLLGETDGTTISIDVNAAGHGWFVDATASTDEEYVVDTNGASAAAASQAVDKIDLLTVVEHELGHVLGLDDVDALANSIMGRTLSAGVRESIYETDVAAVLAID